ncbi:MAG TPA: dihydropteroate synthase [Polyangiaceae bacterium]|nr:dihydropteroate synthase [Polyangiaceae bacterium]
MSTLAEQIERRRRTRGAALMGVLNVTPDSFYDGGRHATPEAAAQRIDELLDQGADILDIGGESSRPGAEPVPAAEQLRRIEPAVRHAVARGALVSVDTTSPEVAEHALRLGASLVNDVSCLADPELASVCARFGATLVLMHSRGPMSKMPGFSQHPENGYRDVVGEVLIELYAARERACERGLSRDRVFFDPGLGFNKSARHSFALLQGLARFGEVGTPLVVGPSRKSFIAAIDDAPPERRLGGTIAACLLAVERGASVLRVHDVAEVAQALAVAHAIRHGLPARETPRAEVRHA